MKKNRLSVFVKPRKTLVTSRDQDYFFSKLRIASAKEIRTQVRNRPFQLRRRVLKYKAEEKK